MTVMSRIEGLPKDIYDMIVELLVDSRDLSNLSKTCKRMYEITVPYLYKSVCLYAPENGTKIPGATRFNVAKAKGFLRHARDIKVSTRLRRMRWHRCMHFDIRLHRFAEGRPHEVDGLAHELKTVLEGCRPGAIRSLDWSLSTCVSQAGSLLGPAGYLVLEQQNIESIRLVTDDSCTLYPEDSRLALASFARLKRLSWTGLSGLAHFKSLAEVLVKRSHQLEELEIDLTWHHRRSTSEMGDGLTFDIKHGVFGSQKIGPFPVLKRLALVRAPFTTAERNTLYRALKCSPLQSLQSLQLRYCLSWENLLRMFSKRVEPPLNLKSLEVQWASFSARPERTRQLLTFLQSFQGVEELFIHVTTKRGADSLGIWGAALHHRASLRRFVHHQQVIDFEQRQRDRPDLTFVDPVDVEHGSADLLGKLDLISLGLCCIPSFMQSFVSHFASKTSLQVLHMRQSGTDLPGSCWASAAENDVPFDFAGMGIPKGTFLKLGRAFVDFAQWVFGPTGIRSLRLLAYGDFYFDGRFDHATLLFCRQDTPTPDGVEDPDTEDAGRRLHFREVFEGDDVELWELYKREKHVLAACPCDQRLSRH